MSAVLLLSTRSTDKLCEIRGLLSNLTGVQVVSLVDAGIEEDPVEDALEQFSTFEENALAKARHFAARSGLATLADDSGLCVDALGGEPGVRSKRFSGRTDLRGRALDAANNALLLERLQGVPAGMRTAHYVCAIALVLPGGSELVHTGTCYGLILGEPRGTGGFGYDPLFFLPQQNATFGEVDAAHKNRLSHRHRALHAARPSILGALGYTTTDV